ncbi:MAG: permease, partial [Clostridium sp.]
FLGVFISSIIGSIAIMPTFVAFSTGSSLLQNGAGYAQVGALISTLTLVGVMTFSLESKYIGRKAAFLRNFIAFLFSFLVAFILGKVMVNL